MNRARQSVIAWHEEVGHTVTIRDPWKALPLHVEQRRQFSADVLLRDRWRIISRHPYATPLQLDAIIAEKMRGGHREAA